MPESDNDDKVELAKAARIFEKRQRLQVWVLGLVVVLITVVSLVFSVMARYDGLAGSARFDAATKWQQNWEINKWCKRVEWLYQEANAFIDTASITDNASAEFAILQNIKQVGIADAFDRSLMSFELFICRRDLWNIDDIVVGPVGSILLDSSSSDSSLYGASSLGYYSGYNSHELPSLSFLYKPWWLVAEIPIVCIVLFLVAWSYFRVVWEDSHDIMEQLKGRRRQEAKKNNSVDDGQVNIVQQPGHVYQLKGRSRQEAQKNDGVNNGRVNIV